MDTSLLLDDAALRLLSVWFSVLADNVDAFNDDAILGWDDGQDLTGLALVVTGIHIHGVTLLNT